MSVTELKPGHALRGSAIADTVRFPGEALCPNRVHFDELERAVRRHLFAHRVPSLQDRAEIFLLVQGEPGVGKTVCVTDTALEAGYAVAALPVAGLASENEGGATQALDSYLSGVSRLSAECKRHILVVGDDFDLSIAATDAKTGKTINSNLLTQRLQAIADTRPYRAFDGSALPICLTGNDFSLLRSSVFRDGRATWVTHRLRRKQKRGLAFHILSPRTPFERRALAFLAWRYQRQPAAFWASLANDLNKARLDNLVTSHWNNPELAGALLKNTTPLQVRQLHRLAKARANTRAQNFL